MSFIEKIIISFIVLLVLSAFAISPIIAYTTQKQVTFTVIEKERVNSQNYSKYLIFTEGEVFENTDSLWYWKFNSSDVYGAIKVGSECNARVYGLRVPFLSWYRNIIDLNCK
jgi:hypothetical protein